MPRVQQPRSPLTGEVLTDETLALAAETHGISLPETSVGQMFSLGRQAHIKKQASLTKKADAEDELGEGSPVKEAASITVKYKGQEYKAKQGMNSDEWSFKVDGQEMGLILGEDEKVGSVIDEYGNEAGTARLVTASAYASKRRARSEKKAYGPVGPGKIKFNGEVYDTLPGDDEYEMWFTDNNGKKLHYDKFHGKVYDESNNPVGRGELISSGLSE